MTAAVITASASIVVAVLVFVLNQRAQLYAERRRAGLDRIERQLRELYGPLNALVTANEKLWQRLHESFLPGQAQRQANATLTEEQSQQWRVVLSNALMPLNQRMRDLLVEHADLLVETQMPAPLRDFFLHVAAYEVRAAAEEAGVLIPLTAPHPGDVFVDYVTGTFAALKVRQGELLPRATR